MMALEESSAAKARIVEVWRRFRRHARLAAIVLFAAITAGGAYTILQGDWTEAAAFWSARRGLLCMAFLLSACDIAIDSMIWRAILRQLGIDSKPLRGMLIFLTGYAGLMMPAQMGRLFRASEMARIQACDIGKAAAAEFVLLYFVAVASASVFMGALAWQWRPAIAILLPAPLVILGIGAANVLFGRLLTRPRFLPEGFWRRPAVFGLALTACIGWFINGFTVYLLFRDITNELRYSHAVMIVTSNLFVAVSSGLPGGLGITEGYIGTMMYWLKTPPSHLVVAVAAFRILTFWAWIPAGWAAVLLNSLIFRTQRVDPDQVP